jgi:ABC-type antimicrobial peptide transport system permease subunit
VLRLIGASALLVLLGGCATLMALVFVHYERRRSELAVRLALGASGRRLAGRLLMELSGIFAAGILTAGIAAQWALSFIPSLSLPGGIDFARLHLQFDWRVVSTGIAATAITIFAAAALPLRRFTTNRGQSDFRFDLDNDA